VSPYGNAPQKALLATSTLRPRARLDASRWRPFAPSAHRQCLHSTSGVATTYRLSVRVQQLGQSARERIGSIGEFDQLGAVPPEGALLPCSIDQVNILSAPLPICTSDLLYGGRHGAT
jgi:hypothetical protein